MSRQSRSIAALAASLIFVAGCGGSGNYVWVTGKLLQSGAPYKPPEGQRASLTFNAIEALDAQGKTSTRPDAHQALLDADGSFKVLGPEGSGIPPGKYRISVSVRYTREAFEALKDRPKGLVRDDDLLKGKFGPATSPIVREVRGKSELVIDLDKPGEG